MSKDAETIARALGEVLKDKLDPKTDMIMMKALGDVLKKRLDAMEHRWISSPPSTVEVKNFNQVESPTVLNKVHVEQPAITNQVAPANVDVQVNMLPVAEMLERLFHLPLPQVHVSMDATPLANAVAGMQVPITVMVDMAPVAAAVNQMREAVAEQLAVVISGMTGLNAVVQVLTQVLAKQQEILAVISRPQPERAKRELEVVHEDGTRAVVRERTA